MKALLIRTLDCIFIAGLLSISSCSPGGNTNSADKRGTDAIPVSAGLVEVRPMDIEIHAVGSVEPMQLITVRSQVGGVLTKIGFKEGEEVQEGQLLFEIDPRSFEADLRKAQAALEKDKAQLSNAEAQLKRYEELVGQDFVTKSQYDEIRTNVDVLRAAVKSDLQAQENAKLQLEHARIKSPISGRTGSLAFHLGDLIKANDVPLLIINQIQPIYVAFSVPADRLPEIQAHSSTEKLKVAVHIPSLSGQELSGLLTFIDNAVDKSTGTIRLKAEFENANQNLWPGQFVDTALVLNREPSALVVPAPAIQAGQTGSFVYVIKSDQTVEKRPVTVKRSMNDYAVVEDSLTAGELVVTDGQLKLIPGARVQIKEPTGAEGKPTSSEQQDAKG